MSQPSVTAYFNTRKRQAGDELRGKSKVLLLERDHSSSQALIDTENSNQILDKESTSPKVVLKDAPANAKEVFRANRVVRNIQFDSPKGSSDKASKPRTRVTRSRSRLSSTDGNQTDIRESLLKKRKDDAQTKTVPFEKMGALSPKKKQPQTPKKSSFVPKESTIKETESEQLADSPTSSKILLKMEKQARIENLNLIEIKNRLNKSSRLMELQARIQKIKQCEQELENMNKQSAEEPLNKEVTKKFKMQKFEKIEVEVPLSPQKEYKSPTKTLLTPTKNKDLAKIVSPQRRLLFEPKETSPFKSSPTKAHQRYRSLVESAKPGLALPSSYRFLAEVFQHIDMVSAMMFNRKELITFKKLKSQVQMLSQRDLTLHHLAQIKTIYPDAYTFHQEKYRNFGSVSKQEKYELVLTPMVESSNGRNTPDADNILKCASESSMSPNVVIERRRKFYNALLERVRDEHEKFLQSCGQVQLLNIPREKLVCWHPMFDVETCREIEEAELPQPPQVEKRTAKDVLDKAKSLFNCGTRMEKALQRLAEAQMTSNSKSPTQDSTSQTTEDGIPKVNITIVDTPPATPSTKDSHVNSLLKGIPKALLEKVRAKQAAKALEAMTRTPNADKEAAMYSRFPELAKLLRNIFVTEKKNVLSMEVVIQKLDNSFRTKLTSQELEEHIRQLCKLLPTWSTIICNARKIDYLKLNKDVELNKVIKQLEVLADDKVKTKVS